MSLFSLAPVASLAVLASHPSPDAHALIADAVSAARARTDTSVTLLSVDMRASGCRYEAAEALTQIERSGDVPVRLRGTTARGVPCDTPTIARVSVQGPVVRIDAPAARGDLIARTQIVKAEITGREHVGTLPAHARALRPLTRGAILRPSDFATGPRIGTAIEVVVTSGGISISESGRVAACPAREEPYVCATLARGRRVSGIVADNGKLVVEVTR